jgi:cytidylate kinase
MTSRVVCISRAYGAGAEGIAHTVAQRLGFRYVDDEIVAKAAEKAGVDVSLVADVERRKSFVTRIIEALASAPATEAVALGGGALGVGVYADVLPPGSGLELGAADHYRELIGEVIRETADGGEVVIVAHAAGMALRDRADVLCVLITGSTERRQKRISDVEAIGAAAAAKAVRESDKARADYFKRFYRMTEEVTSYDLVVNTDRLATKTAAELICAAAAA